MELYHVCVTGGKKLSNDMKFEDFCFNLIAKVVIDDFKKNH